MRTIRFDYVLLKRMNGKINSSKKEDCKKIEIEAQLLDHTCVIRCHPLLYLPTTSCRWDTFYYIIYFQYSTSMNAWMIWWCHSHVTLYYLFCFPCVPFFFASIKFPLGCVTSYFIVNRRKIECFSTWACGDIQSLQSRLKGVLVVEWMNTKKLLTWSKGFLWRVFWLFIWTVLSYGGFLLCLLFFYRHVCLFHHFTEWVRTKKPYHN